MITLSIDNLGVRFGKKTVLHDISASIRGPQMISVIGHNGSGKTTLLKAVAGLISRTGEVRALDGNELIGGTGEEA